MMIKWIHLIIVAPLLLAALALAAAAMYLGPDLHLRRTEQLLASTRLPDSSVLFLVQSPNKSRIEPYTVYLYRLYTNGTAQSCLIGFEESYWWLAGLRKIGDHKVRITYVGSVECIYDMDTGTRTWTDKSYPPLGSEQADHRSLSNKMFKLG